ncbi:hypothetical protein GLYMA_02G251301v4 [Glycine max]|nr:hypothetical protein GLYMA_02G251301v4 [Glycine max]KAH1062002.1 hypothetical protein GYH30_005152 [Glycine max]
MFRLLLLSLCSFGCDVTNTNATQLQFIISLHLNRHGVSQLRENG